MDARDALLAHLAGNPLSDVTHAVGRGLNFILRGGGTHEENQVGQLHSALVKAGLHPLEAQRIAEGIVYHPYNRPT